MRSPSTGRKVREAGVAALQASSGDNDIAANVRDFDGAFRSTVCKVTGWVLTRLCFTRECEENARGGLHP
jgi:hypothetical protein